jgi:PAS domain S-box-containing protein
MDGPCRILYLEDDPNDVQLARATLAKEGLACEVVHVDTEAAFLAALAQGGFHVILSDCNLPLYDGHAALARVREKARNTPFIFLSGTMGEDLAIEAMKNGATDYVLKERLSRLGPAVRRALNESEERAKQERMLEQIREQAALLDVAHDAILVCALDGTVSFWNKGAQRLYGWTVAEALGKNANELLFKAVPSNLEEARAALFHNSIWMGECRQVTRDGKEVTVQSRWTLVRNQEANPQSILVINTDITEQKQLEAQFLHAQRIESLGTLASGIAHDLNNVLTPILMAAQMLCMKQQDEDSHRWIEGIEMGARRGSEMVRQVLTIARGSQGERVVIQMKHLIHDLGQILKQTFPRSVEVRIKGTEDLWTIVGDSTQIYQVLLNLCVNARDAMPEGGRLLIELGNRILDESEAKIHPDACAGPYVAITVSDTGTGIPADFVERIFEPFFTTKEIGKGTGLGLSTVVGIVRNHGGFVTVTSTEGKGTQFKVFLPAEKTPEAAPSDTCREKPQGGNAELVLVVDDEAAILEMTKATLEVHGYRVLTAKDGAEAVAVYAQHAADVRVVVTDMVMPVMSGPTLIRVLQNFSRCPRIIAVGGLLDADTIEQMISLAPIQCLQKPYSVERLLAAVKDAVNGGPHATAREREEVA